MTQVRAHKVTRNGKTYTRQQHTRKGPAGGAKTKPSKLRPGRAWVHAKKAVRAYKHRRRVAAAAFATAAVTEIAAFTVARGVGGVLTVAGAGIALVGYGLWKA